MKKIILCCTVLLIVQAAGYAQSTQNRFYQELTQKEIASFNDAISLIRLLYNEEDYSSSFVDNILWASLKKIFRVTIPINEKEINPIIQRREFAFWLCKIFRLNESDFILNRYGSYLLCLRLNIMNQGRGPFDSFTGAELLDTFTYADYYIRLYNVQPRFQAVPLYLTPFDELPEWRKQLYKELDQQREGERLLRKNKRALRKNKKREETEKALEKLEEKAEDDESNIKYVE